MLRETVADAEMIDRRVRPNASEPHGIIGAGGQTGQAARLERGDESCAVAAGSIEVGFGKILVHVAGKDEIAVGVVTLERRPVAGLRCKGSGVGGPFSCGHLMPCAAEPWQHSPVDHDGTAPRRLDSCRNCARRIRQGPEDAHRKPRPDRGPCLARFGRTIARRRHNGLEVRPRADGGMRLCQDPDVGVYLADKQRETLASHALALGRSTQIPRCDPKRIHSSDPSRFVSQRRRLRNRPIVLRQRVRRKGRTPNAPPAPFTNRLRMMQ